MSAEIFKIPQKLRVLNIYKISEYVYLPAFIFGANLDSVYDLDVMLLAALDRFLKGIYVIMVCDCKAGDISLFCKLN